MEKTKNKELDTNEIKTKGETIEETAVRILNENMEAFLELAK